MKEETMVTSGEGGRADTGRSEDVGIGDERKASGRTRKMSGEGRGTKDEGEQWVIRGGTREWVRVGDRKKERFMSPGYRTQHSRTTHTASPNRPISSQASESIPRQRSPPQVPRSSAIPWLQFPSVISSRASQEK